jgi:Flp pilus assembly protein TadG
MSALDAYPPRGRTATKRGQATVEFSLTVVIFIVLLLGVLDLGRGIFTYNGVSQAAREIARVTSVHPGTTLGNSPETQAVVNVQKGLIPKLTNPTFTCVDIDGSNGANASGDCLPGMFVKVEVSAQYTPVTPLLNLAASLNLTSTSSVQIP